MANEQESRLPVLDGLRGFAALYVVFCHYLPNPLPPNLGFLQKLLGGFGTMGWCGVDLFFVLSGFLITGILIQARGSGNYFSSFYARRVLRIFPLYYALCIVALIIMPMTSLPAPFALEGDGNTLYYWLFLQNFVELLPVPPNSLLAVTWSLATEEQFYLMWPYLLWALGTRRSLYAICAIFVGQLVLRNVLFTLGTSPEALYSWSFTHLDGITLGSILAIAWSDRKRYSRLLHWLRLQTWVTAPIFIALATYATLNPVRYAWSYEYYHVSYHPTMVTVGYSLCGLMFTGMLLYCLERNNTFTHLFRGNAIRLCGRYSYAIYLLHVPVIYVLMEVNSRFEGMANRTVLAASAFVITYVLSALSWHLVEKHILALKRFFPFSSKRNAGVLSETTRV